MMVGRRNEENLRVFADADICVTADAGQVGVH